MFKLVSSCDRLSRVILSTSTKTNTLPRTGKENITLYFISFLKSLRKTLKLR